MRIWLQGRVHVSWHIAWASAGVLVGVALAAVMPRGYFNGLAWAVLAVGLFGVAIINQRRAFIVFALAAGLFVGLWRAGIEQVALNDYASYYMREVLLQGTLAEDTALGPAGDKRVRLNAVHIENHDLPGEVWISTTSGADIKRGDRLVFKGQLNPGFGTFAATMFRAKLADAQRPQPGDVARQVRDWFASHTRTTIPEPQASLGIGFLTGQRSTLPNDLNQQLQILGLTHIVVASGYNLTILVRLARQLFMRASKYAATLSASLMIGAFILVTGFSPSMSRAGLVAGLSLAAWYYGRTIHPLVLLPFAAAITILISPTYIWGDVGWYLSFLAFAGVIMLAPLIHHFVWGQQKQPGVLGRVVIETIAAQIVTMPLVAFVFGQYAPLALPANLLILPFVPLAMLLTCIAGTGALLGGGIAVWLGAPATLVLQYMTGNVGWLAQLPFAQGEVTFGVEMLVASYVGLLIIAVWLWRKTGHKFGKDSIVQ